MAFKYTSIYGAITIGGDYNRSANFIKSLGKDDYYPFINTNMFSLGDYEIPYYYDNMVMSFGATYKSFGLDLIDWNFLVLKLEHILRNIDFEIAQFHIDSFMRNCSLTWIHKDEFSSKDHESASYQLKKTDEWYFGYGVRDIFTGRLQQKLIEYDTPETLGLGFCYPVIFDRAAVNFVQHQFDHTAHLPTGSVIDARLKLGDPLHDRVDEVLYSLVLKGKIDFAGNLGWEKVIIREQPWFI